MLFSIISLEYNTWYNICSAWFLDIRISTFLISFDDDFSAGVGRTGIFIAIDTEMQRMKKKGVINIYNCVCNMRFWRNFMVQTVVS